MRRLRRAREAARLENPEELTSTPVKRSGRLSSEQLEAARRRFAKLKIHPRETLPNRTALELAESLFASLLGDERAAVGHAITTFRLVLATEDRQQIDVDRKRLLAFVSEFKNRVPS